jgi:hypothetical protein
VPVDISEAETAPVEAVEVEPAAELIEPAATQGMVSGQITDAQGRFAGVELVLTRADGERLTLTALDQGTFVFDELAPGDYSLEAFAPGTLSRHVEFTLAAGQALELPPAMLLAGDLNQDNRVDLSDVMLVAANYNRPAVVVEADINGDTWIDISDLALIGSQMGLIGPLPWS